MPAFSHFFLNRLRAPSKDSPSLTRIPAIPFITPNYGSIRVLISAINSGRILLPVRMGLKVDFHQP